MIRVNGTVRYDLCTGHVVALICATHLRYGSSRLSLYGHRRCRDGVYSYVRLRSRHSSSDIGVTNVMRGVFR